MEAGAAAAPRAGRVPPQFQHEPPPPASAQVAMEDVMGMLAKCLQKATRAHEDDEEAEVRARVRRQVHGAEVDREECLQVLRVWISIIRTSVHVEDAASPWDLCPSFSPLLTAKFFF